MCSHSIFGKINEFISITWVIATLIKVLFLLLGQCSKLGLSGRPSDVVGVLATSKVYTLGSKMIAFFPQVNASDIS